MSGLYPFSWPWRRDPEPARLNTKRVCPFLHQGSSRERFPCCLGPCNTVGNSQVANPYGTKNMHYAEVERIRFDDAVFNAFSRQQLVIIDLS